MNRARLVGLVMAHTLLTVRHLVAAGQATTDRDQAHHITLGLWHCQRAAQLGARVLDFTESP